MRRVATIALCILFLVFSGCNYANQFNDDSSSNSDEINFSDIDINSVEALAGRDNTIDEYTSLINHSFSIFKLDNEVVGSYRWMIDDTSASVSLIHVVKTSSDTYESFEDIGTIDINGIYSLDRYEENNLLFDLVPCAEKGLKGVLIRSDDKFAVQIKNENSIVVYNIPLTFLGPEFDSTSPGSLVFDKDLNLHFCISELGIIHEDPNYINTDPVKRYYFIVSSAGEVLLKQKLPDNIAVHEISLLYDGTAILISSPLEIGKKIEKWTYNYLKYNGTDFDTIYTYSYPALSEDISVDLLEDDTVLAADSTGVYICSSDLAEKKMLYKWINHGIRVSKILKIKAQGEGIGVLYTSGEIYKYIYIEPVKEKLEIYTVTVGVNAATEQIYKEAATDFNRLYPTCNIDVVRYDSDEEIRMLTEINAGKGPVLIDTSLTGFDTKKELWEPLDKVLEDMEVLDCLNENALECCKIDGHIYGITTDFYINTTVVGNTEYADLNYDDFADLIKNGSMKYLTNSIEPDSDAYRLFSYCFIHGFDDNYILDKEAKNTIFSSENFKTLVRGIKSKVSPDEYIMIGNDISNGNVLLNQITISRPKDIFAYMTIYGDSAIFAGYPHKDGSYSLISSHMPLSLRKNATKEEKEIACVFIKTLLSYESQLEMSQEDNFGFSVREDIIERQMEAVDLDAMVSLGGVDPVKISTYLTIQKGKDKLYELLMDSKANKTFPRELNEIISEEMYEYFDDIIPEEELCDHLENRVSIYLMEQ